MNIPWTLGAYELGVLFATVLYGIVIAQTFTYTQEKFKDPIWLKALVGVVCLLDTVHTFAIWSLLYYWSINKFGDEAGLLNIQWMFILAFAFSPTIGAIVQSFFAYRMFLLLSRPILPIVIWFGAATRIGFAAFRIVAFRRSKTIPQVVRRYGWVLTTTLAINVALDILNTGGLLYCLLRNRPVLLRYGGLHIVSGLGSVFVADPGEWLTNFLDIPSASLQFKKDILSVSNASPEIGLTTSVCATVTLGLVQYRAHENFIFVAFFALYPKLFANSFLASLNARAKFRQASAMMSDVCIEPGDITTESNVLDVIRVDHTKGASSDASSNRPLDASAC